MVSLLIKTELGLEDLSLAEAIKNTRWPKWKACSVFVTRMARWSSFGKPSARRCSPKWCTSRRANWCRSITPARWKNTRLVRRQAKEKVFVTNCLRALRRVSPGGSIRDIAFVVLVGGSSLDFEIPQLITEALSHYGVVAGQGNIRGTEGPRNAVATGLLLAGQAN